MADQKSIAGVKGRLMLSALAVQLALATATWAGTPTTSTAPAAAGATATQSDTVAQLQKEIESLKAAVNTLKAHEDSAWMAKQRAAEVRAIVESTLQKSKKESQYLDNPIQAGYDNGFFIQTANKNFSFHFNGYFQYRYDFGSYQPVNQGAYSHLPAGDHLDPTSVPGGSANGFGFRYARLIFSGNVFSPRLTYFIQSDFAGGNGTTNSGYFSEKDLFVAYRFKKWLQVKAGSFLVPFTHVEYISSGLEMVDFNSVEWPFDPARAMGVSVYGDIVPNQVNYEVNVNNGANTQGNGIASNNVSLDNRLGFATRWQFGSRISDFVMEPDLRWSKHFQWMLGVAFNFDSQTKSPIAFPAGQGTDTLLGLSSNVTTGFIPSYAFTGNVYRATVDYQMHYRGFAFSPVLFYQDVNESQGAPSPTLASYYHSSSVQQLAYYLQAGYFIVPHKWEVAASYGQMYTLGQNNHMDAYEAGVNYYIIGDNVKLQMDEIYIPQAAFTNQFAETFANAANYITEVQLQVKF